MDALNFTKDVVVGKFQSAKKDNDFVYHDTVPASENLPEIKGILLYLLGQSKIFNRVKLEKLMTSHGCVGIEDIHLILGI